MGLGCPLSGGACPGQTDQRIHSPPVAEGLWGVAEAQPADRDQVFAGGFDVAQVHAKDLGNPGGFAPATADAALIPIVETTDQMPKHRRDNGGAAPPAMHRTTWRGTGTQRCAFAMAWSMPRKSARSWTPRRSAGR